MKIKNKKSTPKSKSDSMSNYISNLKPKYKSKYKSKYNYNYNIKKRYITSLIILLILTSPIYIIKYKECIDNIKPNLTTLKKECNITNEEIFWQTKEKNESFCAEFHDFHQFGYCTTKFYFHWLIFLSIIIIHLITFIIISKIKKTEKKKQQNKKK